MSPRRSLGALLLVTIAAAGCGAGQHSETDKERATPYLAEAAAGPIAVRAVRVVIADSALPAAASTPSPSASAPPQAYLIASLLNRSSQSDSLTSATVSGSAVEAIGFTSSAVSLPPQQVVQLGSPDLGSSGEMLGVGALSTPLVPGTTTRVTFTFQSAGTVSLDVPVLTSSDVGSTASAAPVTAAG